MRQPSDEGAPERGQQKRDLTLFDAVGVGLGAVIGAGIFVVTGLAASRGIGLSGFRSMGRRPAPQIASHQNNSLRFSPAQKSFRKKALF